MSREILYRGFDKENKVWRYGFYTRLQSVARLYDAIIVEDENAEDRFTSYYIHDKETVGQYTGLKDKNGKKIFEGDVVRYPASNQFEEINYVSYQVFFHDNDCAPNSCVGFKIGRMKGHGSVCGGAGGFNFLPKVTKTLEIIGNIHDSPELLEIK